MIAIYKPSGAANEYANLGLNIYKGCSHDCKYCYCKNLGFFSGTCNEIKKAATLENIEADLQKFERLGNKERVHLCFVGDPYDLGRDDNGYIREVLQCFKSYGQPFQVLTKGGNESS